MSAGFAVWRLAPWIFGAYRTGLLGKVCEGWGMGGRADFVLVPPTLSENGTLNSLLQQ